MEERIEAKVLGKQVSYPQNYAPEILVAVPRSENRSQYSIDANELPFVGYDVWHAYEISFRTNNGLPVSGILKLVYASQNEFLVESKSLKLYLNSFNMEMLGQSKEVAVATFISMVKKDLELLLKTTLSLTFFEAFSESADDFEAYTLLENLEGLSQQKFTDEKENPALLKVDLDADKLQLVCSNLLRSNCKITNQPDWGSVFVHIKSEIPVDKVSLLQYIVSFRSENHFHEEVCEMMYQRLLDKYRPEALMVTCIYTRRGGIDICPTRATHPDLLPGNLIQSNMLSRRLLRQ